MLFVNLYPKKCFAEVGNILEPKIAINIVNNTFTLIFWHQIPILNRCSLSVHTFFQGYFRSVIWPFFGPQKCEIDFL